MVKEGLATTAGGLTTFFLVVKYGMTIVFLGSIAYLLYKAARYLMGRVKEQSILTPEEKKAYHLEPKVHKNR